jgi:TPR repeat protein
MKIVCVVLVLVVSVGAYAQSLDDALAAYDAKDYATALKLLIPLAEQGSTIAQVNLAFMVYSGKGTPADASESAKWYRLAADNGDAYAQYSLGVMCENGKGVPQNLQEAVKWWRLSARQGYAEAQYNLGAMYYNGRGVAKDYVRAYLWKSLAAEGRLLTVPQRKARTGRDAIGAVMSQAQLAQARELIEACKASDLEECD